MDEKRGDKELSKTYQELLKLHNLAEIESPSDLDDNILAHLYNLHIPTKSKFSSPL